MNLGCVLPEQDFLQDLQKICKDEVTLLIFDEIKTGVKIVKGGASEYFDLDPDIVCLVKSVAGGLTIGAFGARKEIMDEIKFKDGVFHAGTYNANPLSVLAGVVTLRDILTNKA